MCTDPVLPFPHRHTYFYNGSWRPCVPHAALVIQRNHLSDVREYLLSTRLVHLARCN